MSETSAMTVDDELREWAAGVYPVEAGTELLIRVGLARPGAVWLRRSEHGRVWIDADRLMQASGVFSGGERRIAELAASMLSEEHDVNLSDALTGLDRRLGGLVRGAVAHCMGNRDAWDTAQADADTAEERERALFARLQARTKSGEGHPS